FDGGGPVRRNDDRALGQIAGSTQRPASATIPPQQPRIGQPLPQVQPHVHPDKVSVGSQAFPAQVSNGAAHLAASTAPHLQEPLVKPPRTVTFDDNDDLDVPDFLK
ncbi:MAG: cell division protein FtsZ, partial [Actinobacteria bacterium]|nr:cell division protein FtsZ [Actinomycetota bacterium]